MRTTILFAAFVATSVPCATQQWGTIKGQVVWTGNGVPAAKVLVAAGCPAPGPVVGNALEINPKNQGVANVAVWLVPVNGAKMPIHPKLAAIPNKAAIIDQPCCLFEPRVTIIREGQPLEIHNSSRIVHNALLVGENNSPPNVAIPAGGKRVFSGATALKAERRSISLACNVHSWMGGQIYVIDHPYFALTDANGNFEIKDAPSGNFSLFMRHEIAGWLHTPREPNAAKTAGGSKGQPVVVPAGAVLDLKKVDLKPGFLN
jgi:hypothetical protein